MSKRVGRGNYLVIACWVLIASVCAFGFASNPSYSQENLSLDARESARQTVISKISDVGFTAYDRVGLLLRSLGYSPSVPDAVWNAFPAIRKFDAAFRAAEAFESGSGDRLLAEAVRRLSNDADYIRTNDQLKSFAASFPPQNTPFKFKLDSQLNLISVRSEIRAIIMTLSNNLDRGALGGVVPLISRYFGLGEATSYNIAISSSSYKEILLKSYQSSHSMSDDKLARLGRAFADAIPALQKDTAFQEALAILENGNPRPGYRRPLEEAACPAGEAPCVCTNGVDYGCRSPALCKGPCR